ncbi:cell division protein FtsL [Tuberibacillus sp. Marseille-P3662]|uniref:cell division protein FtsL n=1 Tax=Tuberibacillus sp. Marseille-P3662 TaxID=1965358 RepID=UPI000A1C8251|nr:cell division protein FtsL [Tuberibacillus sp. Marseille-P3662]
MSQVARQLTEEPTRQARHQQKSGEQAQTNSVPVKKGVTKGEKVLWAAGVAVIMALAIFIVSSQAMIHATSKDINQLNNKISETAKVNNQLEAKVTKLSAYDRIHRIAKNKLGLDLNDKNVKVLP